MAVSQTNVWQLLPDNFKWRSRQNKFELAPLSFLLTLRQLSHAAGSDRLEGEKVAAMFGQLRQTGEVQDAGMEVRPLCSNRQGRHHLRPPGEQAPDLIEQVRHITACTVEILPPHGPVPGAHPLVPHAVVDAVGIPHEALPGCVRVKRRGLEAPDS
jgi:hypothetical protein